MPTMPAGPRADDPTADTTTEEAIIGPTVSLGNVGILLGINHRLVLDEVVAWTFPEPMEITLR